MWMTEIVAARQTMVAWALRHLCRRHLFYLFELGMQAWLNEFQGDSFRLVRCSPHLWNEKATLYLDNSYLRKREYCDIMECNYGAYYQSCPWSKMCFSCY
jgi:hypothetical protein